MPSKERRLARLEDGMCAACGAEPHAQDRTKCQDCLNVASEAAAERRAYARKRGLCEACMTHKASAGRGRRCNECADKYLAVQLKRERAKRAERKKSALLASN